jgi:hypothetical protein
VVSPCLDKKTQLNSSARSASVCLGTHDKWLFRRANLILTSDTAQELLYYLFIYLFIYLTTLSVVQDIYPLMVGLVNNETQKISCEVGTEFLYII